MGKLIITYYPVRITDHKLVESLKCKSQERAEEIVSGRNNVKEWKFYETGEIIPKVKKKVALKEPMSLEAMEKIISKL